MGSRRSSFAWVVAVLACGVGSALAQTCAVGQYKVGRNCVACKGGALSPPGATRESQCYCTNGNYYKIGLGCTGVCDATSTTGSSNGQTCDCAPTYNWWNPTTGSCRLSCDSGFFFNRKLYTCVACPGTGAITDEFAEREEQCHCPAPGTAYYKDHLGCIECTDLTSTLGTSADGKHCDCAPGFAEFQDRTGSCLPNCETGTYRNEITGLCDNCLGTPGVDVFTDVGAHKEKDCYAAPGSYYRLRTGPLPCDSATTIGGDGKNCTCAPGFMGWTPTTGACVSLKCPTSPGQYAQGGVCVKCAGPTTGPFSTVTPKPNGGASEADCACANKGNYYVAGVGCKPCGAAGTNTMKGGDGKACACTPGYGNFDVATGACTICPVNTFSSQGTCKDCVLNAVSQVPAVTAGEGSPTDVNFCMCPADTPTPGTTLYYQPTQGCVPCAATITTETSPDGKTCVCNPSTYTFLVGSNTCACGAAGKSCGKLGQPGCCTGLTCKGTTTTNKKCAV